MGADAAARKAAEELLNQASGHLATPRRACRARPLPVSRACTPPARCSAAQALERTDRQPDSSGDGGVPRPVCAPGGCHLLQERHQARLGLAAGCADATPRRRRLAHAATRPCPAARLFSPPHPPPPTRLPAADGKPSPIAEEDKAPARARVLDALVLAPPLVRAQLGECVRAMVYADYPERWPGLGEQVYAHLVSQARGGLNGSP